MCVCVCKGVFVCVYHVYVRNRNPKLISKLHYLETILSALLMFIIIKTKRRSSSHFKASFDYSSN